MVPIEKTAVICAVVLLAGIPFLFLGLRTKKKHLAWFALGVFSATSVVALLGYLLADVEVPFLSEPMTDFMSDRLRGEIQPR